jgi:hypothetical protein
MYNERIIRIVIMRKYTTMGMGGTGKELFGNVFYMKKLWKKEIEKF